MPEQFAYEHEALPGALGEEGKNAIKTYDSALKFARSFLEITDSLTTSQRRSEQFKHQNWVYVFILRIYYPEIYTELFETEN